MIYINDILHLEHAEYISCGVSVSNYKKQKAQETITVRKSPGMGNRAFIEYESLPPKYKRMVQATFGDPYAVAGKDKIKELLEEHPADVHFLFNYRFEDGTYLPKDSEHNPLLTTRERLAEASQYLYLIYRVKKIKESKGAKAAAKYVGANKLKTFYTQLCSLIKEDNIKLPATYARLTQKARDYKALMDQGKPGAGVLIEASWGKANASKIHSEEMRRLLSYFMSYENNLENQAIADMYNEIAKVKGHPTITAECVRERRYKGKQLKVTLAGARGEKEGLQSLLMQNKRAKAAYPLSYVTADGWDVELGYQQRITYMKDGQEYEKQTYFNRHKLVLVLDAFNKYPLGYAIGNGETAELIADAFKNAIDHVKELTGTYHKFWQVQYDNFAKGKLKNIYNTAGKLFIAPAVGNSKAKIIEPWWTALNRKCQTYQNWTGHNVDSKKSNQPNREIKNLKEHYHNQPTKEENIAQIMGIIEEMRAEKLQEWMEAYSNLAQEDKLPLSYFEYLEAFGKQTEGGTCKLRGEGLQVTIGGNKITYDSFEENWRNNAHTNWYITYNPDNTDKVLASDKSGRLQFMLEKKHIGPMENRLETTESRANREAVSSVNKHIKKEITAEHVANRENFESLYHEIRRISPSSAENMLKMMPTIDGQQKVYLEQAKKELEIKEEIKIIPIHQRKNEDIERQAFNDL